MKQAKRVQRHYPTSDASMRQQMRTMHEHFTTHAAAFQTFNPRFGAAFDTEWLAAIELAEGTMPDAVRVGELKEDTSAVETVMEQARRAVQTLYYYVGQAFPGNAGRLDQYGRRDYVKARENHDRMRSLLATAFDSATRDSVALAAKGYDAAQLAGLGSLGEQLTDTNTAQEVQKGRNTEDRDHYVTVQNLAYSFGQEVSAAAKVLYAANAAALGLFRLSSGGSDAERHELTVEPGKDKTVAFATPLADDTVLRLRLFAPEAGQQANVGRTVDSRQKPTLRVALTSADFVREVPAAELGPTGQVLVVTNVGTVPVRVEMTLL